MKGRENCIKSKADRLDHLKPLSHIVPGKLLGSPFSHCWGFSLFTAAFWMISVLHLFTHAEEEEERGWSCVYVVEDLAHSFNECGG